MLTQVPRHERFRIIHKNKCRARDSSAVDQTAERPRKASVLVTTVSHVKRSLHQTRRENEVPTKNRINAKFSRVGTLRVEVDCQNRDPLKEDVWSCLAPWAVREQLTSCRQSRVTLVTSGPSFRIGSRTRRPFAIQRRVPQPFGWGRLALTDKDGISVPCESYARRTFVACELLVLLLNVDRWVSRQW